MLVRKMLIATILMMILTAGSALAGGDVAKGLALSEDCVDCHAEDGKGDEDSPSIAGLDEAKHIDMLKGYKSGEIPDDDDMMVDYVIDLSDQDMADLAAYYATLDGG